MHGITTEQTLTYLLVWGVAFLSSVARSFRDDDWGNVRHVIALGCTSGFLAFGCAAIWVWRDPDSGNNPWLLVGFAALFGALGKEQDKFARAFLANFMKAMKVLTGGKPDQE